MKAKKAKIKTKTTESSDKKTGFKTKAWVTFPPNMCQSKVSKINLLGC